MFRELIPTFAVLGLLCQACSSATPPPEPAVAAPEVARAEETPENHRAAAERLLTQVEVQKLMDAMVDASLKGQFEVNPQLRAFEKEMREFFQKYMSWESLKEDFIRIYVDAFTQRELEDLSAFYDTSTGKKSIAVMPELARQGGAIGARRVQEHLPELLQMIKGKLVEPPTPSDAAPKTPTTH